MRKKFPVVNFLENGDHLERVVLSEKVKEYIVDAIFKR